MEIKRVHTSYSLTLRTLGTTLHYTKSVSKLSELNAYQLALEVRQYMRENSESLIGLPFNDVIVCRSLITTRSNLMKGLLAAAEC